MPDHIVPVGGREEKQEIRRLEFIIDPTCVDTGRINSELRELASCKRLNSFDLHQCFFDDDKLTLYHQSVWRTEGRQMVLLKWRSALRSAVVAVCHRVKHENWTNVPSRRKKIEMEPSEVTSYINGHYMPKKASAPNVLSGKAAKLHDVIDSMKLQPTLHVVSERVEYSLQASGGHAMSITVDSNIRAYRETNVWEDLMASDGQPFGPSAEYPFIVVKVRVPADDKETIAHISQFMKSRLQARKAGISKFQYGCITLLPEMCHIAPRWYKFLHEEFLHNGNKDFNAAAMAGFDAKQPAALGPWAAPPSMTWGAGATLATVGPAAGVPGGGHVTAMLEMMRPRVRRTKKDRGVDPKAFLCNERTTFQWLNFMMLYSLFAVSLSSKGGEGTQAKVLSLTIVCDTIVIYGLVQFHRRRIYFVEDNKKRGFWTARRWNELFGVTIMTVVVTCALTTYLIMLYVTDGDY